MTTELKLVRKEFTPISTIGDLLIDDKFFCFTLEDEVREFVKIPKRTAIPYGRYQVITNYSTRFKRAMPLFLNVPNFEGVRIHAGNTSEDTDGCILLGMNKKTDFVVESRLAFTKFFQILQSKLKEGNVFITIEAG